MDTTERTEPAVGTEEARTAWAAAAREILVTTAGTYRDLITFKQIAAAVQENTGITTTQLSNHWLGDVLSRVAVECDQRGEPLLTSLCVDATGSVGANYSATVARIRGTAPDDGDMQAAEERLACHRFFGADVPEGGGTRALSTQEKTRRDRAKKAAPYDGKTCAKCNMELPANGACDYCD
ncbi:hypothetical protein NOCA2550038 [metagenome]|uniref:Uncharacterized protein n=1 Tax=metagenome TaxID=256318 RepID=A0A2P2CAI6_9ZZZZ